MRPSASKQAQKDTRAQRDTGRQGDRRLSRGNALPAPAGPGAGALTQGVPAGQAAVQGPGVQVQGAVELLAMRLAAALQVAQEVAEPHAQGRLGVPELGA